MSFVTGTQVELLYAMPASGTDNTSTGSQCLSGKTAANPAYALPIGFFQQQSAGGAGKSLLIKGGGYYTNNASTSTGTFALSMTTTAGTINASFQWITGTITFGTTVETDGIFGFEAWITCTSPGQTGAASPTGSLNTVGWFDIGGGNNGVAQTLGTFPAAGNNCFARMGIGAPQTALAPVPTTQYFIEAFANVSTNAMTHCQLTNFYIFGLN